MKARIKNLACKGRSVNNSQQIFSWFSNATNIILLKLVKWLQNIVVHIV